MTTRGERNNNPGNIDFMPHDPFEGQIGIEIIPPDENEIPTFGRYDIPEHGIRAIARLLLNYEARDGCNTVTKLVDRWSQTDQAAYAANVAAALNVRVDEPIDLRDPFLLETFVRAIIVQENGECVYSQDEIDAACAAARGA
jgi:hypothetical protein